MINQTFDMQTHDFTKNIKTAQAERSEHYTADCPYCGETNYSEAHEEWDVADMVHNYQEINCDECAKLFRIE